MKLKPVYILPGLFGVAFISMVIAGNAGPSAACLDKKQFEDSEFNSIIKNKYLDKENHNVKTVISTRKGSDYKMTLVDDTSGYFDYIKPGDRITKSRNSNYISVNRNKRFEIYFDCGQ